MKKHIKICLMLFAYEANAQISFTYSDGNANSYSVTEVRISYDPVTMKESSSGMYSGGEARVKAISPREFRKLSALFEEALADTAFHQLKREKGSGLLIKYNNKKSEKEAILKYKSAPAQKIEKSLKSLL